MKLWLIVVLICFGLGIWLLELMQKDAGYVLISLFGWTLETSFWFAIGVLVVAVFSAYAVYRTIRKLIRTLIDGTAFFSQRRSIGVERRYREGLLHFLTGDFKQASKFLASVSRRDELPVVRVIASAQAIAIQGDVEQGKLMLREAEKKYPKDLVWIYKALIPLLVQSGASDEVEPLIQKLKELNPNDSSIARLEHYKLRQLNNWQGATQLLADKKLSKTFAGDDIENTYISALEQLRVDAHLDESSVTTLWESIPKQYKRKPELIVPYAKLLFATKQHALLEELISFTLDKYWLPDLVDLFAKLESSDPALQLKKAERWLTKHDEDKVLALTLGVLAMKNQLWGKARSYFESAARDGDNPRALYFLGFISEQLKDEQASQDYYKRAAEFVR